MTTDDKPSEQPTQTATPLVLSPQELTQRTIAALPDLAVVEADLEMIFVCHIQYVGGPGITLLPTDAASALEELSLLRSWTSRDIQAACDNIASALAGTWQKVTDEFDAEANDSPSQRGPMGLTMDEVGQRLSREHDEQQRLIQLSSELLADIESMRLKLSLPTPAQLTPTVNSEKESKASGLSNALRGLGGRLASVVIVTVPQEELGKIVQVPEIPSWRTPPVWTEDNPDVKKFRLLVKRASSSTDSELIWRTFQGFGLGRGDVVSLADGIEKLAKQQIAQSQKVMQEATRSKGEFGQHVENIMRLRDVVKSVINFFSPQGQRQQNA